MTEDLHDELGNELYCLKQTLLGCLKPVSAETLHVLITHGYNLLMSVKLLSGLSCLEVTSEFGHCCNF